MNGRTYIQGEEKLIVKNEDVGGGGGGGAQMGKCNSFWWGKGDFVLECNASCKDGDATVKKEMQECADFDDKQRKGVVKGLSALWG